MNTSTFHQTSIVNSIQGRVLFPSGNDFVKTLFNDGRYYFSKQRMVKWNDGGNS